MKIVLIDIKIGYQIQISQFCNNQQLQQKIRDILLQILHNSSKRNSTNKFVTI
ncbi:hypothetical protein pb186bvf_002739 [Paramecium bursaria]